MARKPTETPETPAEVDMPGLPVAAEAVHQLDVLHAQQESAARSLAQTIGYTGTLTVEALENEIRFYQRRSVESLLEVGKRLLVLKELTPHGEFDGRVQRLGFAPRSAQRFMLAAAKTAKSANLAVLATQVKNASAFLELITHDEDTLEELREMDDVDRMSASQLRTAVRNLRGDLQARDDVLNKTHKDLVKLQVQMGKKIAADTDWPDALAPIEDQIAAAGRKVAQGLSEMEICRVRIFEVGAHVPSEQRVKYEAALEHVAVLYEQALERAEAKVAKERRTYEQTLADYRPIEYGPDEGFATAPRLDAA